MGLIGSAIGAAGSIFGGISASKAMKKIQRNVEAQRQIRNEPMRNVFSRRRKRVSRTVISRQLVYRL